MKYLYTAIMPRKPLSTRIEHDLQKEIKKLAIDLEIPLNNLFEEALRDILGKYGRVVVPPQPNATKRKRRKDPRDRGFDR
jgi:hypothetical protein